MQMVSLYTWFRYLGHKIDYSLSVSRKGFLSGQINAREAYEAIWKHLFMGRLTYLHWNKGKEMAPIIGDEGGTLLVRKLPLGDPGSVFVGDVVVLKHPENSKNFLVRRIAATEGHEMVSADENDEPFILENNQCWVLADDEKLIPKEANDSRTFGPVPASNILGRVIYCLRNAVDHGPVQNSDSSTDKDYPVLEVELDVSELAKNHKA